MHTLEGFADSSKIGHPAIYFLTISIESGSELAAQEILFSQYDGLVYK